MVMCKGSSFPKTERNDRNIEVLAAWRSITSNPQFKNVDINELCTEFTKKARCDGTKVVLEPEGVTDIIETLSVRRR
jgi:AP-1-like factor